MDTDLDRARLTRVRAENFRSLRDMTLDLGDLTVLVGRNGAGKSNTVDAIRFVRDSVVESVERALSLRGGADTILRSDSEQGNVSLEVEVRDWQVRVEAGVEAGEGSRVGWSIKSKDDNAWKDGSEIEGPVTMSDLVDMLHDLSETLRSESKAGHVKYPTRYLLFSAEEHMSDLGSYDFVPRNMRAPQRVMKPSPLLEDGENLTSTLREIIGGLHADAVRNSLKALVDGVEDIDVTPAAGHLVAELIYEGQDGAASRYDLGLESDGTIRLVAILAALYQSPPRALTVIEEPERNIHPGALAILADVIREASTRGQVLITTHSPDLIDHFDPDTIRVVERVDGATTVGPMDETQREAVRSSLFSTGELLRMEGLNRQA